MTVKIRLDGREYDEDSREHLTKIEDLHKVEIETVRKDAKDEVAKFDAKLVEMTKRADAAEGRADTAEKTLETERADAKRSKTKSEEDMAEKEKGIRAAFTRKLRLVRSFVRWFSSDDDEKDDDKKEGKDKDKDEKMDSLDDQLFSLSERDLMLKGIQKVDPKFDGKDRSDDYVQAVYDASIDRVKHSRSVHGIVDRVEQIKRTDALDNASTDPVDLARKKNEEWARNAHKPKAVQNGEGR